MAVEKKAVARELGKRDIAVAAGSLAAGGMGFEGAEVQCGSLGPAICAM